MRRVCTIRSRADDPVAVGWVVTLAGPDVPCLVVRAARLCSVIAALGVACGDSTGAGETNGTPDTTADTTDANPTEPTGDVCEDPSDVGIGPAVAVHLRNNGDVDLFVEVLGGCSGAAPYVLRDGGDKVVQSKSDVCPTPCRIVLEGGDCGCSDVGVCQVAVVRIAPGGVYDSAWSGAVHGWVTPPAECLPDGCGGTVCATETQAPAGSYTLASRHSRSIPCDLDQCACEPSSEGWCIAADTGGIRLGPAEPPVEVSFTYPDTTDVTLVLE